MNRTCVLGAAMVFGILGTAIWPGSQQAAAGFGCHGWRACHGGYAWHGCHGRGWGCHGCHGCHGWGCHGCHGYVVEYGCHGCHGCHGWGWGCHGCHGYVVEYGCHGCHGCHGAVIVPEKQVPQSAPTTAPDASQPEPPQPAPPTETEKKASLEAGAGNGLLTVHVPADATVLVNGKTTRSTGELRRYESHGLQPGQNYRYEVQVRVTRQGKELVATKRVDLQARGAAELDFRAGTQLGQLSAASLR